MSASETSSRASSGPGARGTAADRVVRLLSASLADWELSPEVWTELGAVLDSLAAAGPDTEAAALRRALVKLQLAAPDRIVPIGSVQGVRAPARHRERANHLIHALTPVRAPVPPTPRPDPS
ncbi:CATRA system-associated protein [Streptomyces erythrochromogenes]|uniref:CATRA system-associated protein n=1 Tax=Streptomyces erythrochromogenes TaxID=285574 RepID=UPI00367DC05B